MSAADTSRPSRGVKGKSNQRQLILLGGLVAVALALYFYNSNSDDTPANTAGSATSSRPADATAPSRLAARVRRSANARGGDRGVLRVHAIDASRGDVDPTLRLDLLARLQGVALGPQSRSLFEAGAITAPSGASIGKPPKSFTILPGPRPTTTPVVINQTPPIAPIPLKFYGFTRNPAPNSPKRGFFLDGDNVLVAAEGEILKQKYRVVQLGLASAVMEDTSAKNQQTLPLTPEDKSDQ